MLPFRQSRREVRVDYAAQDLVASMAALGHIQSNLLLMIYHLPPVNMASMVVITMRKDQKERPKFKDPYCLIVLTPLVKKVFVRIFASSLLSSVVSHAGTIRPIS